MGALKFIGGILELRKVGFRGLKGLFDVKKTNFRGLIPKTALIGLFWLLEPTYDQFFYGICHRNCALKYIGGILELRKVSFRGLKGPFDVKKANFRELLAKNDRVRPF